MNKSEIYFGESGRNFYVPLLFGTLRKILSIITNVLIYLAFILRNTSKLKFSYCNWFDETGIVAFIFGRVKFEASSG